MFRSMKIRRWLSGCGRAIPLVLALNIQPVSGVPGQAVREAEGHAQAGLRFAQQNDLKNAEAELRRAVDLSPNNPEYLTGLGGILGMQQKLEESTSYLEKALKLDPDNLVIRRNLASNHWQMGHFEDAKQRLQKILSAKPGEPRTTLLLGMVEESLKNYAKAVELLQTVPALVKQQPESVTALSRAYYRRGEKQKARELLEVLLDHPAGPRGVFLGAQAASDAEDYKTAEKFLALIPSSYPDRAAVGYSLAVVQYEQDRFEESRKTLFELIAGGYETAEIYSALARCYQRQGNSEEAMKIFNQAFERIPQTESEYLKLGNALLKSRFFPAAQELAKKAIQMFPNSGQAYYLKGSAELELRFCNDAVESFTQAVNLRPGSPEANLGVALALWGAGKTVEAAAAFEQVLKRFPRDIPHYTEYARMLLKLAEAGDEAKEARAISLLQAAMTVDRSQAEPHYMLGNFLLDKGKIVEALKEIERAAQLEPHNSKIHFSLARIYRRLGRGEEASREMQAYQETKSDSKEAH
jgi:pentatricopeptide repeat protein